LRRVAPFSPNGESLGFLWRNANKSSVVIDCTTEQGAEKLLQLLGEADVWVESGSNLGEIKPDFVIEKFPGLVITSITPFGYFGPYAGLLANDDVLEAMSGMMFKAGIAPKSPLLPPTALATDVASISAAVATVLAFYQKSRTGEGQHIDLAIMTAAGATTDWSYSNASVLRAADHPYNEVRQGGGFMYPIFECLDGWVRMVILSPRQWESLWDWMGRPEAFGDMEFWSQVGNRIMNADVLNPAYSEFFADKKMLDICIEGQNRGIVLTPLLKTSEVLQEPHLGARGTFTETAVANGEKALIASGFFELDGVRHGFTQRAPDLDEHTGFAFEGSRLLDDEARGQAEYPLSGVRVLDFGIGGVGVETSRLLGEYGADVIKVETRTYPDFIRLVALSETSPSFVSSSRSKRSFGCNVKTEEGLAIVHELVAKSDVLVENSATGVMESLGLGFEDLKEINPNIVMISSQLVGSRGPNSHWTGYGPTTQTYGGLLHLWDYDDDDAPATNGTIFPDHAAGRLCALAGIASLIGRDASGNATHTEIAQVEVVVNMIAEKLLQESLIPGSTGPQGNRHEQRFPRGPFQCQGEEQWVVISIDTDQQWMSLVNAMGAPEWALREAFNTVEGRLENKDLIESHLAAWTSDQNRDDVFRLLQEADVPCGPMIIGMEMLEDPHLEARGWTLEIDQPGVGYMKLEGPAWVSERMGGPITFPAPDLAGETREIAAEVLEMPDEAVTDLINRGILEV
jgi:crotonobetainyl-CoA:carnitine CoA-transferase CaiB-like acyl-CoA transferase